MMETIITMMIVVDAMMLIVEMAIFGIKAMVKKNVMTIIQLIQTNVLITVKSVFLYVEME
jgi:cell shape-determining protein MreD